MIKILFIIDGLSWMEVEMSSVQFGDFHFMAFVHSRTNSTLINELNTAEQTAQVQNVQRRGSNVQAPLLLTIDWMSCSR